MFKSNGESNDNMSQALKIKAAAAAIEFVEDGMKLGIGTGSTAEEFIKILAAHVAKGLNVVGVATSERSHLLCSELGIALSSLDDMPELDLTIDGADEIDPQLNLIKGGGAALLREKIVAAASARMIVIADESKTVEILGKFPLPIEINIFGAKATCKAIERLNADLGNSCPLALRGGENDPLKTDGGHWILDASFGRIANADTLSAGLLNIPGVVQHGLFLGMADTAIVATGDGVDIRMRERT